MANTLETRGLARRARSDVDRRLVTMELTARGEKLVSRAQAAAHRYERRFAAALSEPEQRSLGRLLQKLDAAARDLIDEQASTDGR